MIDAAAMERTVDPHAMLQAFCRFLPPRDHTSWVRCNLERVRYLPGKSWSVLYRLGKSGEPLAARPHYYYAEFVPPARSLRRFLELRGGGGQAAPSGFVAELNMIYWRFPADPRLAHLPAVYREGQWDVVSYVPGTSCVLSGEYSGEPTILKLFHDDRVARLGHVIDALRDAGVTAPRVLHVDTPRQLVVLEHVPGVLFWSEPAQHLKRDVMGAMARELARLHEARLPDDTWNSLETVPVVTREWERLRSVLPELCQAFPALVPRFERLASLLEPLSETEDPVLLHGSFHPAQFLIHHGTPRLIDFDSVCLGDPMYDLARFASHLYDRGYVHDQETREVEKAVSAFRSAYIAAATGHFDAPRWFWHLSLSLVSKRAYQVLTRLEVGAASVIEHLLTIAEQNAVSIVRS
jgi:aminoglycoside phosphotransferase (APT) family kinase protein